MKRTIRIIAILIISIVKTTYAQIGINNSQDLPDNSAQLDVKSKSKGLLLPRMTSIERKAIENPAIGLLVFDLDANCLFMFDGQNWLNILQGDGNKSIPFVQKFGFNAGPISISGNFAIIGANIFHRENDVWVFKQKLIHPEKIDFTSFGESASISGNYLVIGESMADNLPMIQTGAAYVFHNNGNSWDFMQKLTGSYLQVWSQFGRSVGISNDFICVGMPNYGYSSQPGGYGAAFIYKLENGIWTEIQVLDSPYPQVESAFGSSISMDANNLAIGSNNFNTRVPVQRNFAGVYTRNSNTWSLQQVVTSSDTENGDKFDSSLSISGDILLVGADSKNINSNIDQGAVYFFRRNNNSWSEIQKIIEDNGVFEGHFGRNLSIYGTNAIIGIPNKSINFLNQGCSNLYKIENGILSLKRVITENYIGKDHFFGSRVAIDSENILITSPGSTNINNVSGAINFGKINN